MNFIYVHAAQLTTHFSSLQSKVDVIGMYHAIAKDLNEFNGGSDLVRGMAQYVEGKPKKFKVSWQPSIYRMHDKE